MKGIDVSYANDCVDFKAIADAGYEFVIVRLGYGNCHLDDYFYSHINGAKAAGLKVGVYYYSYALIPDAARAEAEFALGVLNDCGLTPAELPMGVWFDMEDADDYKDNNGMPDNQTITDMCNAFVRCVEEQGYLVGVYASYSWLTYKISVEQLGDTVAIWNAEWGDNNDMSGAMLWQYSDAEYINGQRFDVNECLWEIGD